MVGPVPAREDEAARLTGARGDFVASLGTRLDALRVSLRAVEESPSDGALRNGLLRRLHALSSAARVLGFASVAEALTEAEKRLRKSEFGEVARAFDVLPSLLLGLPVSLRPGPSASAERAPTTWPLSVLIFGASGLADAIQAIPGTHVECERTEDLAQAREQARIFGPDLAIIDADRSGARELLEALVKDLQVAPVPLIVVGDFSSAEAASAYLALGAARVLAKPVTADTLRRTVVELRALTAEPQTGRDPLGELSMVGLADRIALEVRRGLLEAAEPSARSTAVPLGDGADVMAAVWGAVARVRELVTLHSNGAVRFDSSGPEGAVPMAAWSPEERRAGERSSGTEARSGEQVSLEGRRIVIADDDPAVVWFMSGLLKALGVDVLEAHDGARALALTYDFWPDLVVSDVLMPKLDGFSLCHEIKRDVAVRDVPVVLLSWKEDLLQRVRELGGSADGYLRKEAAAATVAERLREVLRPRARVEQRILAGGEARGRLDGLTPRLILELASAGARDVRVGIRDAAYLYEVQVRRGKLCSATRSSTEGSFERGEFVLAALLGVSAGRFMVEPDATHCRIDFEGTVADVLKAPIERARAALSSISAGALVGVTRVDVAPNALDAYLACTPEPARGLLERIIAGASPRELITSGSVAPRLLEAVLSDIARRGTITRIERIGEEPAPLRGATPAPPVRSPASPPAPPVRSPASPPAPQSPPAQAPEPSLPDLPSFPAPAPVTLALGAPRLAATPSLAPKADDVTAEDAGWFALRVESSRPPPALSPVPAPVPEPPAVGEKPKELPFSTEVTPSVSRRWERITEGVFSAENAVSAPRTLEGVGMPEVARPPAAMPAPAGNVAPPPPLLEPARAEELDALASALTDPSPSPSPAAEPGLEQEQPAPAVAPVRPTPLEDRVAQPSPARPAAELSSTLVSRLDSQVPHAASARVSPLKTLTPSARVAPGPDANGGGLVRLVFVAAAAFAVAYFAVSYYRMQSLPSADAQPSNPAPLPATS
jgi:DNA-binding response OmpR family regulator